MQLHFAHGYLAQNFFSALSNRRTDAYGGSAENRARYLLETFCAVRKVWPEDRPLTVRLSVVEYDDPKHDQEMLEESIALLKKMKQEGLDLADISIGFNTPQARIPWAPHLLADTAQTIRRATGLPVTTSWYISQPEEADGLIREEKVDLITLGRPLLVNPHWPYQAAKALQVEKAAWATLPASYAYWLERYR